MHLKLFASIFLIFIGISYAQEIRDPSIDFNLTKLIYVSNESITGMINLSFNGNIDPGINLTASLNNINYNKMLRDYLVQSNLSFTEVQSRIAASSPGTSKILNFNGPSSNIVGFKLPAHATVSRVDMLITGDASVGLTNNVSLDLGNDGTTDWKYVGSFRGFSGTYSQSSSADLTVQNSFTNLNDNQTYLCESIDLPLSRDFKIFSNYKYNGTGTSGDLNAGIFSLEGTALSGGANTCDLPEPTNEANWYSCNFSYSIPFGGTQLACIYSNVSGASYKIGIDPTNTQTAYRCTGSGSSISCNQFAFGDYFIRVQAGNYDTGINGSARLSGSSTQSNNQPLANAITDVLSDCSADSDGYCIIPLKFSSGSSGRLILQDLIVTYEGIDYNQLHDLAITPRYISAVRGNNLTNYTLYIPLSVFNIKAPTPSGDSAIYSLRLSAGSSSRSRDLKVYKNAAVQEGERSSQLTSDLQNNVNEEIDDLNKVISNKSSLINNLGVGYFFDVSLAQLLDIKNQLNSLNAANITFTEKQTKVSEIESKFNALKPTIPTDVLLVNTLKDTFIAEPNDLDQYVSSDSKKDALLFQDKLAVSFEANSFTVQTKTANYDKTSIKRKITAKEAIDNAFVYEEIPKSIANDVNSINFSDINYIIVNADPIVKWPIRLSPGETKIYSYVVNGNVMNNVNSIKTLVLQDNILIAAKEKPQEKEKYVCGDNICTTPLEDETTCPQDCLKASKIPWLYIIIGGIIILVGIFYFNFYRGRGNIRELTKMPFAAKQDLFNVVSYIKSEVSKGTKKEEVSRKLISKGWTSEQVLYAFDEVDFEKERVKIESRIPAKSIDLQPAKEFIEKALSLRMDEARIKNKLLEKGWTSEQVNSAYKEASKLK